MSFSNVKIHYCRYIQDWDKLADKVCKSEYIGFDVEYVQTTPATIQISTMQEAYVLHIFHYKELPKTLINLLENEQIIKIGVGVKKDLESLNKKYNITSKGALDIGWTAYLIGAISEYRGIDFLGEKLLGEKKLGSFATWSIGRLEKKQIDYAAKDAWIGIAVSEKIYNETLTHKEKKHFSINEWMKSMANSKIDVLDYCDDEEKGIVTNTVITENDDVVSELKGIRKTKEYLSKLRKEEKEQLKVLEKNAEEKKPKKNNEKKETKKEQDELVLNIFFEDNTN